MNGEIYTPDGQIVTYHKNGNMATRYTYANNLLNGECEEWLSDGKPYMVAEYKNGVREGNFLRWYQSGALRTSCKYTDGKLDGCFAEWLVGGKPSIMCNYENGVIHGEVRKWDKDRKIHLWFEDGVVTTNFSKTAYPVTLDEMLIFTIANRGEFLPIEYRL